ncbi:MAG: MraY family glycosyltransferase [Candidatus Falkowbacteria bacterium]
MFSFGILAIVIGAAILSAVFTFFAAKIAAHFKIVDQPDSERKIHKRPVPLIGGAAIFLAFNFIVAILLLLGELNLENFRLKNLIGIFIAGLWLVVGGLLDDKFNLKPRVQIIFPILAIATVIASGIGIDWISNPFSAGLLYLDKYVMPVFWAGGVLYKVTLFADIFTLIWLLGMTYSTKLLDGLDGLVAGISFIASIFIFFTSLIKDIPQYDTALLALVFGASCLGFLFFNFHPAKIFLGEGGSTFCGFMLGVLSIVSGSKIAITVMLMAVPLLDLIRTVVRRLLAKKSLFKTSDKKHIHHLLLDFGFSHRSAVLLLYLVTMLLGAGALLLQL